VFKRQIFQTKVRAGRGKIELQIVTKFFLDDGNKVQIVPPDVRVCLRCHWDP
jgi:hypothetical protein